MTALEPVMAVAIAAVVSLRFFISMGMGVVVVVCIRLVVRLKPKRIAKIELMGYLARIKTKTKRH